MYTVTKSNGTRYVHGKYGCFGGAASELTASEWRSTGGKAEQRRDDSKHSTDTNGKHWTANISTVERWTGWSRLDRMTDRRQVKGDIAVASRLTGHPVASSHLHCQTHSSSWSWTSCI